MSAHTFDPFHRFWGFRCDFYYPSGGMADVETSFDTEGEARAWMSAADEMQTRWLLDMDKRLLCCNDEPDWRAVKAFGWA